jgi:galacturan 1,4-alpha-galacturonidase
MFFRLIVSPLLNFCQPWWNFFTTTPRLDGDGRPISLTLFRAVRGVIRNFAIEAQPFWCNCVAESQSVVYDGMRCNASNTNPAFAGQKYVLENLRLHSTVKLILV